MGAVLEELVVNERGVFLKPEHGGKAVMAVPIGYPAHIRVDNLGRPHHIPQVIEYVFRKHPDEIRGFTITRPHDHQASIRYYACKII